MEYHSAEIFTYATKTKMAGDGRSSWCEYETSSSVYGEIKTVNPTFQTREMCEKYIDDHYIKETKIIPLSIFMELNNV